MDHESAVRWLENNQFHYYYFPRQGPDGVPLAALPGDPNWAESILWDVSGWAWYPNGRDKERIHKLGLTLAEAAERAHEKWAEVTGCKKLTTNAAEE